MKRSIALLSVCVGAALLFSGCSDLEQVVNDVANEELAVINSEASITKAEFDQIKNGMTYDEVKGIIGGEGELSAESGEKGSEFYTVIYMYQGEGELGANANFTFQGGKLQMKAQIGLK